MTPSLSHLRNAGNPLSSSLRLNGMKRAYGLIPAIALTVTLSSCSSTPAQMTVHGIVRVVDNEPIDPLPVNSGTQVTITDPSGKVIGVASLGNSDSQGPTGTLTFGYTVKVPEGDSYYGVRVSGLSGTTQFTEAQMQKGPAICGTGACG
jgi:hypothetical protein